MYVPVPKQDLRDIGAGDIPLLNLSKHFKTADKLSDSKGKSRPSLQPAVLNTHCGGKPAICSRGVVAKH